MLLVYFGLAILVYMQFGAGQDLRKNRNVCIWIAIYLFVISAMKEISANGDLRAYARAYEMLGNWDYSEIIDRWSRDEMKDGFFYVVAKAFGDIGISDRVWMGFIALVFGVAVAWFIYRNSAKPVLSVMLLMTLEYYRFTLSGLRQTVALAVIVGLSYGFMLDRKPIKFILSVLLASLFHSSAILFLPAYLVAPWKIGWKQVVLVLGVCTVYFIFPNFVRWVLAEIAWTDTVANYAQSRRALTWSGVIIQGCILAFCLLFRNETLLDEEQRWRKIDVFINCMIVGLCLQILATMIAEAFRLAYYYNICCIAAISNEVVENKREENHSTMYMIIGLCLVAYMLWSKAYFDMVYVWQV